MVNLKRYHVIIGFRTLDDLLMQARTDGLDEAALRNMRLETGSSIFEIAIAHDNYAVAEYMVGINTPVNVITKEGYNEFHIIAPHLRRAEAVSLANWLLDHGVDLAQQESRYGNTALMDLQREIACIQTPETLSFLQRCIGKKQGLLEKNKYGKCAKEMIEASFNCAIGL